MIDADGYLRYSVTAHDGSGHTAFAHVLVAEAFHGPKPSDCHQVAHRNGSRLLNTPSNLRWATCKENHDDRIVHQTDAAGCRNGRATITDDDVRFIRVRYREIKLRRLPVKELDDRFGLSRSQVIRIARGQAWSHVT
ncbi:HNH endonuclease signature motif containing protein [Lichenicola cladoniae]|nr:HNH endonuclease signature motif containing protein [Lichenicola cladoniae]